MTRSKHDSRATHTKAISTARAVLALAALLALAAGRAHAAPAGPSGTTVHVTLSEWKIVLEPPRVPPGRVTFEIANAGSIPHAFEVEGKGVERQAPQIPRGGHGRLDLRLLAGTYEVYCPIGNGSHKMLGMNTRLAVGRKRTASAAPMAMDHEMHAVAGAAPPPHALEVTGGGSVIQILPGPYPFADSAAAVIASRPEDQRADLTAKSKLGPYSNNVRAISGTIRIDAFDRGATGDSVSGVAEFTAQDSTRWKLVIDRVQTRDIPDNPRFGGVIMGLFYHGASGVHTPLVPTIQSSLALWAYAHLYHDGRLVTDDAMVHVMLLSRTRRPPDYALDCWDCTRNPIDELQLQVTTAPGAPKFDSPGGFLFVNWEQSEGHAPAGALGDPGR